MALKGSLLTIKLRTLYPFIGLNLKASHFVTPTKVGVHDFKCLKVGKVHFGQFKPLIPVLRDCEFIRFFIVYTAGFLDILMYV